MPDPTEESKRLTSHVVRLVTERDTLRDALEVAGGDLHMMKLAVEAGDPKREILCRIGDAKKVIDDALAALTTQEKPHG